MQTLIALRFGPSDHSQLVWVGEHDRPHGLIRDINGAKILEITDTDEGFIVTVAPHVGARRETTA